MMELRMILSQWFKKVDRSWPDEVWEEFILDQLAFFSMAFDYNRCCRHAYDKKPKKSYPDYLNYPCAAYGSDSDLFLL